MKAVTCTTCGSPCYPSGVCSVDHTHAGGPDAPGYPGAVYRAPKAIEFARGFAPPEIDGAMLVIRLLGPQAVAQALAMVPDGPEAMRAALVAPKKG